MASEGWQDHVRAFRRNRLAVIALALLCILTLTALLAPWIAQHDPGRQNLSHQYEGPSWQFWLGTDFEGHDIFSRVVHGARVSLAVGVISQLLGMSIGLVFGMTAGLGGRRADSLLMRLTDISYSFPDILLLILLVSVFGPSVTMITLAIAFVSWTTIARLVRGQVLSLREEQFVSAARALGATDFQIAHRHLLPNIAGPVVVAATFGIPQAMFAEAALSYIGLGLTPPNPSWGLLVVDAKAQFEAQPFLALVSCSVIAVTMLSFTLVGDGLRDALDPRTARRKRPSLDEPAAAAHRPGPTLQKAA